MFKILNSCYSLEYARMMYGTDAKDGSEHVHRSLFDRVVLKRTGLVLELLLNNNYPFRQKRTW